MFEFTVAIVFEGTGVLGKDVLSGPEFEVDWSARWLQLAEKITASATAQQNVVAFMVDSLHSIYVAVV